MRVCGITPLNLQSVSEKPQGVLLGCQFKANSSTVPTQETFLYSIEFNRISDGVLDAVGAKKTQVSIHLASQSTYPPSSTKYFPGATAAPRYAYNF